MRVLIRRSLRVLVTMAVVAVPIALTPAVSVADAGAIEVPLGTHQFCQPTAPQTVVATATADQVGFESPGQGAQYGPASFQVAGDGTVWLLDEVNRRLLFWQPGHLSQPSGTVALPDGVVLDFFVAPDGTIYVTQQGVAGAKKLSALTGSGQPRWQAPTAQGAFDHLRMGPDNVLYLVGNGGWLPLTTAAGQPLAVADQLSRRQANQPVPGGQLAVTWISEHELKVALLNSAGATVRTWHVTSTTAIEGSGNLPALQGRDPVIPIQVYQYTNPGALVEHLVLKLTSTGAAVPVQFAPSHFGDPPGTEVLVGPADQVYQLRTSRDTGVAIVRYAFAPTVAPTPTGGAVAPAPPGAVQPTPTITAAQPTLPVPATRSGSGRPWWPLAAGGAVLVAVIAGVIGTLIYRRRHPTVPPEESPTDTDRPTHLVH